jgi:hypothetical protein
VEHRFSTTVRFSVFVDPRCKRRALASLSESPSGASPWQVVSLSNLIRPLNWKYSKLLYELSKDNEHAASQAKLVGQNLYKVFFSDEIKGVFESARKSCAGPIRVAIDSSLELVEIPWELLHDDHDFLLRRNCSVIRVARESAPGAAYFGPVTRVGLIAVTSGFDAKDHIDHLAMTLTRLKVETAICRDPTRQELMEFVERERVDSLYFLGHGKAGQVLLKADTDDSGWLDAADLADCLPEGRNPQRQCINLVYLSSCGTAQRQPDEGVFSGVAQRLMLSGRVGTVVAMQAKIGVKVALKMATTFFERLVRRGDPESALLKARTAVPNLCARSIPVLYTHEKGPSEFVRNRLSCLLGARAGEKVGVSLPGFRMGLKYDDYQSHKERLFESIKGSYYYRGPTYAQTDVSAAKELLDLLTEVVGLGNVEIVDDHELPGCSVVFVFGSRSHERMAGLFGQCGTNFKLEYGEKVWAIVDLQHGRRYELAAPTRQEVDYRNETDWGIIEKIVHQDRCYFLICGLGDRATRGCACFLARKWEELLERYLDGPFGALVQFPGGADHTGGQLVDRTKGDSGTS